MRLKTNILIRLLLSLLLISCSEENGSIELNHKSFITDFKFKKDKNNQLSNDIIGLIDEDNKRIVVTVEETINITSLNPSIQLSSGATVTPQETQDFSFPVKYKVIAEDGTFSEYLVVVLANSQRYALQEFSSLNDQSQLNWDFREIEMTNWTGIEFDEEVNVTAISLNDKNIQVIPHSIKLLTYIKTLNLSNNQINEIPVEIGQLKQLTTLVLGANYLTSLPLEIGQLSNLVNLQLYNNAELKELPPEISQLQNLKSLSIANCALEMLPQEIGELSNISFLDLSNNKLPIVPSSIGKLGSLVELFLNQNELETVPQELSQLSNPVRIKYLSLSSNKLISLPKELAHAIPEILDLRNNNLTSIPQEICDLQPDYTILYIDEGVICE